MKLNAKAAQNLRRQIKTTLTDEGFTGKFADVDAVCEFVEDNGLTFKAGGKELDKKMLMNILGGSIELEPAEDVVEGDAMEEEIDEPKMADEDKPKAGSMNRINAKAAKSHGSFHIANPEYTGYDRKASQGKSVFRDGKTAELFMASVRLGASKGGGFDYPLRKADETMIRKAGSTADLSEGGSLIPVEVQQDIQEIKEQYGIARQLANFTSTPSRAIDITVSDEGDGPDVEWTGENPSSTTEASVTLRPYTVLAKKLFGRYRVSTEIFRTPGIGMVDFIAREFVRTAEKKVDNAYFQGDGTSTYGTNVGIRTKLIDNGVAGSNAGLAGSADGTWTAITLADFEEVMGLTGKGDTSAYQWCMGRLFFYQVVLPLIRGVGGTAMPDVESGPGFRLHGAPVVLSDVGFPTSAANNSVVALYGDFRRGSHLHEVSNSSSFSTSEHRYADTDQIGLFYRYEAGMAVYGHGSASEAGCIVGLATTS
jgi:HK97 family phage major capsid protein